MTKRPRPKAGRADRKPAGSGRSASAPAAAPLGAKAGQTRAPQPLPPPPPGPPAEALALFERGMSALQGHDYGSGRDLFRQLIEGFPGERGLLDRARVYRDLCDRELRKRPAEPHTIEERLTAATAALNNRDDDEAERLVRTVLADTPRHELGLYLLAAVSAHRGHQEAALVYLGQAIEASPEIRVQARHDPDFEALFDLPAFRELIEVQNTAAPRRPRRGRSDR